MFINDVKKFLDTDFTVFADDLKMFRPVKDVDALNNYCTKNKLILNAQKCNVVNFTRNTVNFIAHSYNIDGFVLDNKALVKDLGVLFDAKLPFSGHINKLYNDCIKLLGFIFRTCADFKDPVAVITLFNSLIRSKPEYCSTIWSPHFQKYIKLMEKLQKKLVRFLYHKNLIHPLPSEYKYLDCCKVLGIDTLEKGRIFSDLKIFARSLKNQLDTQSFIEYINFAVPQRATRQYVQFELNGFRTEAGKFTVFNRLMSMFNTYGSDCNLFHDNLPTFLKKLMTNLNTQYKPSF